LALSLMCVIAAILMQSALQWSSSRCQMSYSYSPLILSTSLRVRLVQSNPCQIDTKVAMPRRAAALATPATSTPLTDGTLVQHSDDPFASQVSLLVPVEMGCLQPILLHLCHSLQSQMFLLPYATFSLVFQTRPFSRLAPPSPRHIYPLTYTYPPPGHRGRFNAVYIHRHPPSNASLARSGYAGSKTFVRLVHSLASFTPLNFCGLLGWTLGRQPCESSTRNEILILTQ
jgi:hypothetical protein